MARAISAMPGATSGLGSPPKPGRSIEWTVPDADKRS